MAEVERQRRSKEMKARNSKDVGRIILESLKMKAMCLMGRKTGSQRRILT